MYYRAAPTMTATTVRERSMELGLDVNKVIETLLDEVFGPEITSNDLEWWIRNG